MAERRMLSKKIIDSDAFLEMPLSAQALYMHLNQRADDDGFLNNPKRIQRMIGASDDDLKLLLVKRFILGFESGVIVIKHWRMNNLLRKDRYNPTQYQDEFNALQIKENGAYTEVGNQLTTTWQLNGNQMAPQYSIGKDSIDKDSVVVEADTDKKWLSNRLTNEQWDKLSNQYHDVASLIDYVDNLIDDESDIKNPFKYIVSIAEKKNWPKKGGCHGG